MTAEKLCLGTGVLLFAFALNACSDDNSAAGPKPETKSECTAQENVYDDEFEFTCGGKIAGSTKNGFCKLENPGDGSASKTVICGGDTVGVFYGTLEDTTFSDSPNPNGKCSNEGGTHLFQQPEGNFKKYICINQTWKEMDSLDSLTLSVYDTYGIACDESRQGDIIPGKISDTLYYQCENGFWIKSSRFEYDTKDKTCDESNEGKIIGVSQICHGHTNYYICTQGNWNISTEREYSMQNMGKCDSSNIGKTSISETVNTIYKCTESGWEELSSSVFWIGNNDDNYRVKTGLNCENEESGKWLLYSDKSLGGNSNIEWPTEPGNEFDDTALDPIIEVCSGICGTFILGDKITFNEDTSYAISPFVGVEFSITNNDTIGGDITDWGGISISYEADASMFIELVPENEKEFLETDNHFVIIPRSSYRYVQIPWSKFNPWSTKNTVSQKEFLKKVVAIRIYIQQEPGRNGNFGIYFIGTYNASPYLAGMDACPNG